MNPRLYSLPFLFLFLQSALGQQADSVYFTTGFKIGELTHSSAILWTRLCADEFPVPVKHARRKAPFRSPNEFNDSSAVEVMDGAVRGILGQVKIRLASGANIQESDWEYVSAYEDFTFKKPLEGLSPGTLYKVQILGRREPGSPISEVSGSFRTPPAETEAFPLTFTSSSCQYFWDFDDPVRGFRIYDAMMMVHPDFHCQTGDYVYYDKPGPMANKVELARHKWHAMNAWPALREFYAYTPVYLQKDDHDMLYNDAYPQMDPFGDLSFQDGLMIWYEQVPLEGKPFRTFRWGKDLQIWLVEGREFRSSNHDPDGPEKSIWGLEQKDWFVETVRSSDASFKILLSPTPVVGPDRSEGKNDNHANSAFATEGQWLRDFLGEQGVFVINGDRHWQYVSRDSLTGVLEFSQGPSSDSHAQGWDPRDRRPEHRFLRVNGGFLAVAVYRKDDIPYITFTHRDVNGLVVHEETFVSEKKNNTY